MKKTYQSFVSGCRVNEAEKVILDREMAKKGYSIDTHSPQVILINSCAITAKAERETRQLVYQLQNKHPQAQIILTGCSATLWLKNSDALLPNVTYIKNSEKLTIPRRFDSLISHSSDANLQDKFLASGRLFVKIQDGCHRFCSYCIVPYLRGTPQSTSVDSIIQTISDTQKELKKRGLQLAEVTLTAINTESYGKDTKSSLVELVQTVLLETDVPRIGFGSVHPWSLTDEFLDYYRKTLSKEDRFVQFFHVPLQSCSKTTLKLMKREYEIKEVMRKLKEVHTIRPDALIATDIIVGFLGETDELFEETYEILKNSPISRFHVFRFSNRPHTAAFYLKNHLFEPTAQQKKKRAELLIQLSKEKYQRFVSSLVGIKTHALVIQKEKQNICRLLLHNNVEARSNISSLIVSEIYQVRIEAVDKSSICSVSTFTR